MREHGTYWFVARAVGSHGLEYHWWHQEPDSKQGHEIPVEPGLILGRPRFTVYNALPNRDYNGWYWCVIVDRVTGESITTPRGQLVVVTAPRIVRQPTSQQIPAGGTAEFSVVADAGAPVPVTYQWLYNGRPILNARKPTLVISNAQSRRSGYYTCRVRSLGGKTDSGDGYLTVVNE